MLASGSFLFNLLLPIFICFEKAFFGAPFFLVFVISLKGLLHNFASVAQMNIQICFYCSSSVQKKKNVIKSLSEASSVHMGQIK